MAPTKDLFLILRVTSHVRGESHVDVRTQCGIMTLAGEEFGGGGGGIANGVLKMRKVIYRVSKFMNCRLLQN